MTVADWTLGEFLDAVASKQVTPSGGATAAVGGAMGAALCEMCCLHTVNSGDREAETPELTETREAIADRREQLLALADEDVAAVEAVQAAFDSGDDERIQTAIKHSTAVPLETAELCLDIVERASLVTATGTSVAVPDAVVGTLLAHAALRGAVSTVRANLGAIDDQLHVTETEDAAARIAAAGEAALADALTPVDW